ncbi:membrane protein insertase YidC [Acuticoccus sediminis]|uniref:Membrane protein insertase YidC n=1 Tax=Acuticoccus sediminis TaxID=2184697 RepID=A0A8B2NIP7_9HYPH|nr:membrane protein insertase YidC [Acuticoccus sediminis]RAH99404.1 membrane protein insertase YidC [Acuticoccus sediminis]
MGENRNMFLAIGLSLAVIVLWQFFFIQPQMEAQRQAEQEQQIVAQQTDQATDNAGTTAPGSDIPSAPRADGADVPQAQTPGGDTTTADAPRVPIATPSVDGSINLAGGRLDDLKLRNYHVTPDPSSDEVVLLAPAGTAQPYFVETGWVPASGQDIAVPTSASVWSLVTGEKLTTDTPVTIEWDNGAGVVFRRNISVDDHYMFTIEQTVQNNTDQPIALHPYSRVRREGDIPTLGYFILHEGFIGVLGEEGLVQEKYKAVSEEGTQNLARSDSGWLGITDKYWATTVIPDPGTTFNPRFLYRSLNGTPAYQADYLADAVTVAPGEATAITNRVFAGAKKTRLIQSYEESLGIDRFNLLIDWGWFYFITKPMFYLLDWIQSVVGNFGVAILITTVLVKLLFFPLAQRAYTSMAKMKALQPKIKDMQERYKDDRVKQQQAMMELYKKEKVNPLAGCIPIVIQIPVFFSLYKVIFVSIEMRHAPFFGWINDLSAPDPTTVFNLFGLLPYDPMMIPMVGSFLHIGVWPLIMGCTMWLQMKMNPTPPDPTQAMIFNIMPIFFTFLLASFPAGLVIYWAWNNSLSVLQQYVIMRRHGVKVELWGNIASIFRRGQKKKSAT